MAKKTLVGPLGGYFLGCLGPPDVIRATYNVAGSDDRHGQWWVRSDSEIQSLTIEETDARREVEVSDLVAWIFNSLSKETPPNGPPATTIEMELQIDTNRYITVEAATFREVPWTKYYTWTDGTNLQSATKV